MRHNYWGWIQKTPILPPKDCLLPQMDFFGNDIGFKPVDDPVECFNECMNRQDCACWTHIANQRQCYLKGPTCPDPTPSKTPSIVSGPSRCPFTRIGCFWKDMDHKGHDINSRLDISTPEDCLKICQDNNDCKCWTLDTMKNACWIKSECTEGITGRGLVSGTRECNTV